MWWIYVVVGLLFVLAIWGFTSLAGFETRLLSRRTLRRAEDLYPDHKDQAPRRRKK